MINTDVGSALPHQVPPPPGPNFMDGHGTGAGPGPGRGPGAGPMGQPPLDKRASISGPPAGPNLPMPMDSMNDKFRNLHVDSDSRGRQRGGFESSSNAFDKKASSKKDSATYEGWTLYRGKANQEDKLNWSHSTRTRMHLPQEELVKLARKRKSKSVSQQYNGLSRIKRQQIDELIEDRKYDDNDPGFEWTCVYIDPVLKDIRRSLLIPEYVTTSINLVLERHIAPGVSSPPRIRDGERRVSPERSHFSRPLHFEDDDDGHRRQPMAPSLPPFDGSNRRQSMAPDPPNPPGMPPPPDLSSPPRIHGGEKRVSPERGGPRGPPHFDDGDRRQPMAPSLPPPDDRDRRQPMAPDPPIPRDIPPPPGPQPPGMFPDSPRQRPPMPPFGSEMDQMAGSPPEKLPPPSGPPPLQRGPPQHASPRHEPPQHSPPQHGPPQHGPPQYGPPQHDTGGPPPMASGPRPQMGLPRSEPGHSPQFLPSPPSPPPPHPQQGPPPPQPLPKQGPPPPPQHHPPQGPPPSQFGGPPSENRFPQDKQKQRPMPPKVINNSDKRRSVPSFDMLSTPESSIGDNDSARFENGDDSSATEDLFTPDDHEKFVHVGGRGGRTYHREPREPNQPRHNDRSRSRSRAPDARSVHYPSSPEQSRSDHHGVVDLIPSRSRHRPRPGRSMTVTHPGRFHPKPPPDDRDRGAYRRPRSPVSPPLSPHSLSPPVKYMDAPFPNDFVREKDWARHQRDAEHFRHEYLRNRRLQEREEELEQRELDLIYREMRLGRRQPPAQGPPPPSPPLRKRPDRSPTYPQGRFGRDHVEPNRRIRFDSPPRKFM